MTTNNTQLVRSTTDLAVDAPRQPTFRELMRAYKAKEAAAQPAVAEALENRTLRSVSASFNAGVLTVSGDNNANLIGIAESSGGVITVYNNGTALGTTYNESSVTKIVAGGGTSADTIEFSSSGRSVQGESHAVTDHADISAGDGDDLVYGTDSNDTILGGWGGDTMYGANNADRMYGDFATNQTGSSTTVAGYADSIYGDSGDDIIQGQTGSDLVEGGAGSDWLYGDFYSSSNNAITDAGDTVRGGQDGDVMQGDCDSVSASYGTAGYDVLEGNEGADLIFGDGPGPNSGGANGQDTISGGAGGDTLYGGYGDDVLYDVFQFGDEPGVGDRLYGGGGNDTFTLSGGDDFAFGEDGNDVFNNVGGDGGNDSVDGGSGSDTLNGSSDVGDTVVNM